MKTSSKKSSAGKIVTWSIVALVLVGAAAIVGVSEFSEKSTLMSKAFVFFISAVIVVQVVPGDLLKGALEHGQVPPCSKAPAPILAIKQSSSPPPKATVAT